MFWIRINLTHGCLLAIDLHGELTWDMNRNFLCVFVHQWHCTNNLTIGPKHLSGKYIGW